MFFSRMNTPYRDILLDFRADMFHRLTIIMAVFCGSVAYAVLLMDPIPFHLYFLAVVFGAFSLFMRRLSKQRLNFARYCFVTALYLVLAGGMILLPKATWLAFMVLPILMMSALLVSNTVFLPALLFYGFTALLHLSGRGTYPLDGLALLLGLMVAVTHTVVGTFYTALEWYSSMHRRADSLLEESRDRRAELVQTLKSLEIAYDTQKRLQQQLVYARKQAEEARRLKERFASNISHELRTPLNLILGFSEIMVMTPEVYGDMSFPATLQRDIYQIHRNSKHLLEMIDDVLDLSHIELTQFSLNFEPTDLNTFMNDTVEMMRNLFRKKEVQFFAEIQPNLPTLEIDRTRIRQVIINLITNAHRFTQLGQVIFAVYQQHDEVILSVKDTGSGIAPDKLALIFEEFYQVDYSLSRQHGGAGLGLPITRRFVEAHDGRLSVESEEGQGSIFKVALPLPESRRFDKRGTHNGDSNERPPQPIALVVDPDPHVLSLIRRHAQGWDMVQAATSDLVQDAVQQYQPRAVIVNRLPEQALPPIFEQLSIPVLVCALPSTMWLINQLGVADCLAKPVRPIEIAKVVERYPEAQRLLVVDDDLGVVQLVQRSIEAFARPCTILRAYDGAQALDILKEQQPDLIFLDLSMPDTNGFELLDAMRADAQIAQIPVILLTATQYIAQGDEMQSNLWLRHPNGLRPMEVLRSLNALLQVFGT